MIDRRWRVRRYLRYLWRYRILRKPVPSVFAGSSFPRKEIKPTQGNFYYDSKNNTLYIGTGEKWEVIEPK